MYVPLWLVTVASLVARDLLQMVWSEDESCLQRLSESLEYMTQPKRELKEVVTETNSSHVSSSILFCQILERAAKILKGSPPQATPTEQEDGGELEEEEEEEEEDEDEEEDAYDYGMEDPDVDVEPAGKKL